MFRLAWVLYLALALAAVAWIGARRGVIPLSLFVDPTRWLEDAALGAAAALLLLGSWLAGRRLSPAARRLELALRDILGPMTAGEALALALLSGFAEELFFRGAVQGAWGWLPATLIFALLHTGPGPAFRIWTLFAALAGLTFAGLMEWRGNLLAPVLAHFLVNAVNLGRLRALPAGGPRPAA